MAGISKKETIAIILLIFVVPVGLATKFYSSPAADWINNSLGGVFYEIFWCLLFFLFFSNSKVWKIAGTVFILTCVIELLQLWHPPLLENIRDNLLGRTFLGNSFNWYDFLYYIVGSLIGYLILKWLQKTQLYSKDKT